MSTRPTKIPSKLQDFIVTHVPARNPVVTNSAALPIPDVHVVDSSYAGSLAKATRKFSLDLGCS